MMLRARSGRAVSCFFFFQAEDGIRDLTVTGVQTCALPISRNRSVTVIAPSAPAGAVAVTLPNNGDRKSTRLNSSHSQISYAVFCLKKKKKEKKDYQTVAQYYHCTRCDLPQ